ncbi:MAG: porin family protein [Candidatus Cyclobacteriaceae bacterium M2_1C_046]
MKKLLLLVVCILGVITTKAQIEIGVTAGANIANVSQDFADPQDEIPTDPRLGIKIGVVADYSINDNLSLRSGLVYSSKGFSIDMEELVGGAVTIDGYNRFIINYLDIPITGVYKLSGFEIMAGPYLAFGLSGEQDYDLTIGNDREADSEEIEFTSEVDAGSHPDKIQIRGFDAGIRLGLGYEIGPGVVTLSYSKGFVNLTPDDATEPEFNPEDEKITNCVISIGFNYFF